MFHVGVDTLGQLPRKKSSRVQAILKFDIFNHHNAHFELQLTSYEGASHRQDTGDPFALRP